MNAIAAPMRAALRAACCQATRAIREGQGECLGPSGTASEKIGAQARLKKNSADAHAGPLLPLWTSSAPRSPPQLKNAPEGTFR